MKRSDMPTVRAQFVRRSAVRAADDTSSYFAVSQPTIEVGAKLRQKLPRLTPHRFMLA
jgi:hypothetical protein